jgi:hypothetical protein
MSYRSIDALANDALFSGRVRACTVEQSEHFAHDERPAIVTLARDIIRGEPVITSTFIRLVSAAPGIATKAGEPPDQSRVTDADILSAVQAFWPVVADLYYSDDGERATT